MGLLDFFQAASNTAAENVSAPVDGLAWLLKKAGVPVGDTPVGGSAWMREKGLTRPVNQSAASLAGETLGLLSPIVASAKAPQIAGGLLQMADNAMKPSTMNSQAGAIVWHGSPHKFDKFDSSKIGTGEGAQAYGHGLYLAENKGVAQDYASKLPDVSSPYTYVWNGQTYEKGAEKNPIAHALGLVYHQNQATAKQIAKQGLDDALKGEPYAIEMGGVDYYKKMLEVAQQANKKSVSARQGSLYKVDLPDEAIAKMLDWDKPLSQQAPEVNSALQLVERNRLKDIAKQKINARAALVQNGGDTGPLDRQIELLIEEINSKDIPFGGTGESYYKSLRNKFGTQEQAANYLKEMGIPGIRYLDGGSRGAGQGTSNFVVFPGNEDLLTILERNGQGLLGR